MPVAIFITFIAKRRPSGPQPAAYGHIQTLTDLVDEWLPTMYWGHKGDNGVVCHAGASIPPSEESVRFIFSPLSGTSGHPLPNVSMDRVYA